MDSQIAYPLQPPPLDSDMAEIPPYIVHCFQIHQESAVDDDAAEGDIDINYYERNFPIGSIFSFSLQSTSMSLTPSDSSWDISINPATFHVGAGAELHLTSATLDPSFQGNNGHLSLFISTDVNPDFTCIGPFISRDRPNVDLKVSLTGPSLVQFALVNHYDDEETNADVNEYHSVNIFGSVKYCKDEVQEKILEAKEAFLMLEDNRDEVDINDEDMEEEEDLNTTKAKTPEKKSTTQKDSESTKKRKLSVDEKKSSTPMEDEPKKLTKKQRKKLAKQKELELQNVVAKENKHEEKAKLAQSTVAGKTSLTKPRMIDGGILIQDIVHGTGTTVKTGRKVSMNYVGTLESGQVFDKNQSKANPLKFRIGTGEVIKGLDKGLVGMKANGERIITIPSNLAYGSKGSGLIPGDATLVFEVKLLTVGGK
ncbi:hypothetical protein CTEN210_09562 [Chaetoceros tenuissimus]|uniref:peptidylprolyl isomerase n=1 Tax=Chaetoceros tenuissimus TaxID=426638 RepID=A0AAD3H7H4_9STRA|nr:hypothetical protein CTEN210_09562 [Chaetoceros tenuissimus]